MFYTVTYWKPPRQLGNLGGDISDNLNWSDHMNRVTPAALLASFGATYRPHTSSFDQQRTKLWSVLSWIIMLPVSGTRTLSFIYINLKERVHRRAVRWVMSDFQRTSSPLCLTLWDGETWHKGGPIPGLCSCIKL